jgi:hypothetical protein
MVPAIPRSAASTVICAMFVLLDDLGCAGFVGPLID